MVQDAESQLTEVQSRKLLQFLFSYTDVFANSQDELGRTNVSQHHIHTADAQPIPQATRQMPASQREEMQALLQDMQKHDVFRLSNSPWASPIVLVWK